MPPPSPDRLSLPPEHLLGDQAVAAAAHAWTTASDSTTPPAAIGSRPSSANWSRRKRPTGRPT